VLSSDETRKLLESIETRSETAQRLARRIKERGYEVQIRKAP
jgi:hypothetical protein